MWSYEYTLWSSTSSLRRLILALLALGVAGSRLRSLSSIYHFMKKLWFLWQAGIFLILWGLWAERNNRIFKGCESSYSNVQSLARFSRLLFPSIFFNYSLGLISLDWNHFFCSFDSPFWFFFLYVHVFFHFFLNASRVCFFPQNRFREFCGRLVVLLFCGEWLKPNGRIFRGVEKRSLEEVVWEVLRFNASLGVSINPFFFFLSLST